MQTSDNIKSVRTLKTNNEILYAKYTDDKQSIAVGHLNGTVALYNTKNLDLEIELQDNDTKKIENCCTGITYRRGVAKNTVTCSYTGGLIKQWHYSSGTCVFTIREDTVRQITGVTYHPKLAKIFAYGDDGKIIVYDEHTKKLEASFQPSDKLQLDGHVTKIQCLTFNPHNPNEFLTGGWDYTLHYWDLRVESAVRFISDIFLGGEGITINKTGTEFVTCEYKKENPMKHWDYRSGELIQTIKPDAQECRLYVGKYIAPSIIAAGGADENIFRLVSLQSYNTVASIRHLPYGITHLDYIRLKQERRGINISEMPNLILSAGKNIYEVKF